MDSIPSDESDSVRSSTWITSRFTTWERRCTSGCGNGCARGRCCGWYVPSFSFSLAGVLCFCVGSRVGVGSCAAWDHASRRFMPYEGSPAARTERLTQWFAGTGHLRAGDERFGRTDRGAQATRAGKLDHRWNGMCCPSTLRLFAH